MLLRSVVCGAVVMLLLPLLLLQGGVAGQSQFSFCQRVTTNGVLSYSSWASLMQGTFTASSLGGNLWNVTAVTGYRNVSVSAGTGQVASSVALVGLQSGSAALGAADGLLTFPSEFTFTDASGITVVTASPQTDITGCVQANNFNIYADSQQVCGLNGQPFSDLVGYASFSVVSGSTPPPCSVPPMIAALTGNASSAVVSFTFCYVAYTSSLVPPLSLWASLTTGTLTAQQTSVASVYSVVAASGYRLAASGDGLGAIASNVSLGAVSSASASCFGGCDQLLYWTGGSTAATLDADGLTLNLRANQSDPSGCSGSAVSITAGNGSVCLTGGSSNALNSFVAVGSGSTGCSVPASPAVVVPAAGSCSVGSTSLSSLSTADLPAYYDCVTGVTVTMRLCAPVSNAACVSAFGGNSMVCLSYSGYELYNAAVSSTATQAAQLRFSFVNGANLNAGVYFNSSSGDLCGNSGNYRQVSGVITCGCQNAVTSWVAVAPCQYVVSISSPAVCAGAVPACVAPPLYSFSFCYFQSTQQAITASSWTSLTTGVMTAQATGCGYQLVNITGYRLTSSNSGSGAVSSNASITALDSVTGDPDNVITYPASPTFTSVAGVAFDTSALQTDRLCSNTDVYNIYVDVDFECGNLAGGAGAGGSTGSLSLQPYNASAGQQPIACSPPKSSESSPTVAAGATTAFCCLLLLLLLLAAC